MIAKPAAKWWPAAQWCAKWCTKPANKLGPKQATKPRATLCGWAY